MFYERLKELCKIRNTTITAVSKKLNISTSQGTAWKKGTLPNCKTLIAIAQYLNTSTDYLLDIETNIDDIPATNKQLKVALFGSADIDDSLLDEIKQIAKIQLELKKRKVNTNE